MIGIEQIVWFVFGAIVVVAILAALWFGISYAESKIPNNSPNGIAYPVKNQHGVRVGRNAPCDCGSDKKSKKCCRGK